MQLTESDLQRAYVGPERRLIEVLPLLHAFAHALCASNAARIGGSSAAQRLLHVANIIAQRSPVYVAECGVYQGSSLVSCAKLAKFLRRETRFIGLDTFLGLPPLSATDISHSPTPAALGEKPLFSDTSLEGVIKLAEKHRVAKSIELISGLFALTLPKLPERRYIFVNIDCDLYEPHIECLEYFYGRVEPGGIVFFDDYHSVEFPMARAAVDHFMAGRPERLIHLRFGQDGPNMTKAFFIKAR
jgi:O-methyltransferase